MEVERQRLCQDTHAANVSIHLVDENESLNLAAWLIQVGRRKLKENSRSLEALLVMPVLRLIDIQQGLALSVGGCIFLENSC